MDKNISIATLILRVGAGGMLLTHGWGKFLKVLNGDFSFGKPLGIGEAPTLLLAVFAEFACSILLIIGYRSKLAAIAPALTMVTAAFVVHLNDPWGKKEFPLLYLTLFVAIYLLGSGRYSLDAKLGSKK